MVKTPTDQKLTVGIPSPLGLQQAFFLKHMVRAFAAASGKISQIFHPQTSKFG